MGGDSLQNATVVPRRSKVHAQRVQCRSIFFPPLCCESKVPGADDQQADDHSDEKDMTAANWTFRSGMAAGKDTDTLSSARLKYYPLRTVNGVIGVMGVLPEEQERFVKMEQERLLQAFANQAAIALERGQFWEQICKQEKKEYDQNLD